MRASLLAFQAHPFVRSAEYYNGGFDSESGYGYEIVLKPGFCDPHGAHSMRSGTAREMKRKLGTVKSCECNECNEHLHLSGNYFTNRAGQAARIADERQKYMHALMDIKYKCCKGRLSVADIQEIIEIVDKALRKES